MATDTKLEMGLLEKVGEKFSNFGDNTLKLITRLFGSSNERFVRKVGFIAARDPQTPHTVIPGSMLARGNVLEPQMAAMSDTELKELAPKFRDRLKAGATMEDIHSEAFAACRERGQARQEHAPPRRPGRRDPSVGGRPIRPVSTRAIAI